MFIDSGRIIGVLGKETPLMTIREELKVDKARDEWRKLIAQGWRRTKPVWEDYQYPILLLGFVMKIMRFKKLLAAKFNCFKSNKAID